MCDYIVGELILSFPKIDLAAKQLVENIRQKLIQGIEYKESLEEKLAKLGLKPDDDLEFEFHRVRVHAGEELWKVTYLQSHYKREFFKAISNGLFSRTLLEDLLDRYDYQFTAAPNSILSPAAKFKPLGKDAVKVANFAFSKFHTQYRTLASIPSEPPPNLDQITIAIIDSGIADDVDFKLADQRCFVDLAPSKDVTDEYGNLVEPSPSEDVTDEYGHGTLIALILRDLAPSAQLIVYKVFDANGRVSEWDTLAALAVCAKAHIVNLSLQFGLVDRMGELACNICGRESRSSRSIVFENLIGQFEKRAQRSILVGAAGNNREDHLAFPARFAALLAISAVNSKGALSFESNYGKQYNVHDPQDNRFVCPGGDEMTDPTETVGSFGHNDDLYWHGTSFAAAYASGIVANLLAQRRGNAHYSDIINELRKNADDKVITNYDQKKHGHGLMRLSS